MESSDLTLYHGSRTGGIKLLAPTVSTHEKPLVYLTKNRAVALFYTVNAIERFYEQNGLQKPEQFPPFFPYGFDKNGVPSLDEYYPNAAVETYGGKSGYIYTCRPPAALSNPTNIYCAVTSAEPVVTLSEQYVPDVYASLLALENAGELIINRHETLSATYLNYIKSMIKEECKAPDAPYAIFAKAKGLL